MNYKKITKEEFLYQIAKLHYIDKISQKKLANMYKKSTATISRALQEAEELKIIEIKVKDMGGTKEKLENEIRDKYGLKNVDVSYVPQDDEKLIKKVIGKSAASFIDKLMVDNVKVGIAWGTSIYEMTNFLNPKHVKNMKVIDLIGSVGKLFYNTNASELAKKFAYNFSAENYFLNSLAIVQNKETKDFLTKEDEIKEVFEIIKKIDIAIISIGPLNINSSILKNLKYGQKIIDNVKNAGAVGDICLRYFDVNGKRMQDGSTKTMVYGVNFLISYLSKFMSLQPGDIISTGTPPGVGMGMKPQVFLKPGDEMKLGIEGLGEQTQKTIKA